MEAVNLEQGGWQQSLIREERAQGREEKNDVVGWEEMINREGKNTALRGLTRAIEIPVGIVPGSSRL